jgi:hypothetical protein
MVSILQSKEADKLFTHNVHHRSKIPPIQLLDPYLNILSFENLLNQDILFQIKLLIGQKSDNQIRFLVHIFSLNSHKLEMDYFYQKIRLLQIFSHLKNIELSIL